jgi:hypothetical protein
MEESEHVSRATARVNRIAEKGIVYSIMLLLRALRRGRNRVAKETGISVRAETRPFVGNISSY